MRQGIAATGRDISAAQDGSLDMVKGRLGTCIRVFRGDAAACAGCSVDAARKRLI